jgi:hypothetical protein
MSDYTMAQAKRDFERGFLKGFEILYLDGRLFTNTPTGYSITIESKLGMDGIGRLVDAKTKQERVFKTLDAAVSALRQIGFSAHRLWGEATQKDVI